MSETIKTDAEKLADAYKALDAIHKIVGDSFCEDLDMRVSFDGLTGELKTAQEKLSTVYCIAHSESPNHSCHPVHEDWRKLKDEVLKP